MWTEWEMKNWHREQMHRKWRGNVEEKEAKEPRMRWENYVKRDTERVGGEWRTTATYLGLEIGAGERSERKLRRKKR